MTRKLGWLLYLSAGLVLTLSWKSAYGTSAVHQIDVDEFGHMAIRFQDPKDPDVFVLGTLSSDAGLPGSVGLALTYVLPFTLTGVGDVQMREHGDQSTPPVISDVVRFVPAGFVTGVNVNRLIFYSDKSLLDPAESLADTGLPTALITLLATGPKVGTVSPQLKEEDAAEGSLESKLIWGPDNKNPDGLDPGFFTNLDSAGKQHPMTYNLISEGVVSTPVPEPITMFSAFMGLSSLGMYIRKRMKAPAAA